MSSHIRRAVVDGGAPLPWVELSTRVPGLGPVKMDLGGAFSLTVYSGPMMSFKPVANLGRLIDVQA